MTIRELDLKEVGSLDSEDFLSFRDLVSKWYSGAKEELLEDIKMSKYCKLYFLKEDSEGVIGGLIISDIHLSRYFDVQDETLEILNKLDSKNYFYLMWLYLREDLRGQGFAGEMINFILKRYPRLCLETENDSLVRYYKKYNFNEVSRDYCDKNLILMAN